jgi:hypothetical protein
MNRDLDLDALLTEAADPAAAQRIIELLHGRVQTLQQFSYELRIALALLQRSGGAVGADAQRLQTELRDLRRLASRASLDPDTFALLSADGSGLHLPMPAPMEQTLQLEPPTRGALRDLRPLSIAATTRLGSLLALTSGFHLHLFGGLGLPLSEDWRWQNARRAPTTLARGERFEAMCAVDEFAPPKHVLVVTRSGWCRALPWSVVENLAAGGAVFNPADHGDTPVWIGPCEEGDVLLVTRLGRYVRFPLAALAAAGEQGVSLESDDDVAAAALLPAGRADACAVHFIGADGAQFAIAPQGLEANKRAGGKTRALTRNWLAQSCAIAARTDAVAMFAADGEVFISTLRSVPVAARPVDARPLNIVGQRLLGAVFFGA